MQRDWLAAGEQGRVVVSAAQVSQDVNERAAAGLCNRVPTGLLAPPVIYCCAAGVVSCTIPPSLWRLASVSSCSSCFPFPSPQPPG